MKIRGLVNFTGLINCHVGQVKEVEDSEIVRELIKANYIEEIKENPEIQKEIQEKPKEEVEEKVTHKEVKKVEKTKSKKK